MPFVATWMDLRLFYKWSKSEGFLWPGLTQLPRVNSRLTRMGVCNFLLQPLLPVSPPSSLFLSQSIWVEILIHSWGHIKDSQQVFMPFPGSLNLWRSPFQGPFGTHGELSLISAEPWILCLSSLFCSLRAWLVHLWSLCEGNYGKCLNNHCVSVFFEIDLVWYKDFTDDNTYFYY